MDEDEEVTARLLALFGECDRSPDRSHRWLTDEGYCEYCRAPYPYRRQDLE